MKGFRILIFLLLAFKFLSAQQPTGSPAKEPLQLTLPREDSNQQFDPDTLKNGILLSPTGTIVYHADKKYPHSDEATLLAFLVKNATAINKKPFYILLDSVNDYKKVVSLIDLMHTAGIKNYRIVFKEKQPAEAVNTSPVQPGASPTGPEMDSSWLVVTALGPVFRVSFEADSLNLQSANDLDKFIAAHKQAINGKKVALVGSSDLRYEIVESIVAVFRKHSYDNYQLIAK